MEGGIVFIRQRNRSVAGCGNHVLKVWEVAMGQQIHELYEHKGSIRCVAFSPEVR
jgi:hypothetical protein